MQNKKISIIIVNWNGKKWMDKCLKSLLNQTYHNYEIILVDNNSSDGSVEHAKLKFPKVRIIVNKKNLGFAYGNNIGIDNSKGELIMLLNSDTWVKRNFVEKLINFYSSGNLDVVAPREAYYDGKKKPRYSMMVDLLGHSFGVVSPHANPFYLPGICLLFAKKLYIESKGLDDNFFMYSEEVDWFWRLKLLNKKYSYADTVYVYHEGAGSTGRGIKYEIFLWRNQNVLQMLLKNYSLHNLLWVLPLYLLQNIFEIISFFIILKPQIAHSYIEGWWFNLRNIKKILDSRKWVQKNRIIGDIEVLKKMYFGFGKLNHLYMFLKEL